MLNVLLNLSWLIYGMASTGSNYSEYGSIVDKAHTTDLTTILLYGDWGIPTSDFFNSARFLTHNISSNFTVLLGDNFYDNGVSSTDDPLWNLFLHLSSSSAKFFAVLGNHDYQQSVDPQLEYQSQSSKWIMPAPYYYKRILLTAENGSNLSNYPTERLSASYSNSTSAHSTYICGIFLDSYRFTERQLAWAKLVLGSHECRRTGVYRMVFTHYPIYTVGIFHSSAIVKNLHSKLKPVLEQYGVHAYFSGHEHDMQLFENNGVVYLIAGSISDKSTKTITKSYKDIEPIWRNVGTAGVVRMSYGIHSSSDVGTSLSAYETAQPQLIYKFVSTQNGDTLYQGVIPLNNTGGTPKQVALSREFRSPIALIGGGILVIVVVFV